MAVVFIALKKKKLYIYLYKTSCNPTFIADFHLKWYAVAAIYAELTLKQCVRTSMVAVCIWTFNKKHLSGHHHEVEYYLFLADFGLLTFATVAMIVVVVRAFCANKSVGRTFVGKSGYY